MFYTLIKHVFSTKQSARCYTSVTEKNKRKFLLIFNELQATMYLSCPFLLGFCDHKIGIAHHGDQHVHNQQGTQDQKQEKHNLQQQDEL